MHSHLSRKQRLELLLDLAATYRGITRRELAGSLDRDPSRIVPESGVPKIDLVVHLAGILDWTAQQVLEFIWVVEPAASPPGAAGDFATLQTASRQAHVDGRYAEAVTLAQQAHRAAGTSEERALACVREGCAWDGLGHYRRSLEAVQRGLAEPEAPLDVRLILESNLANGYYVGWRVVEARAVASDLIEWYQTSQPDAYRDRATHAFAHYVRGNARRRMRITDAQGQRDHMRSALGDLTTAESLLLEVARDSDEDSWAGIASTCRNGIYEVEVALGQREPLDALGRLHESLDAVTDVSTYATGDWLESYGWGCIFGCNIALRHLSDERELHRYMGIFTTKADEIAQRLDNWALRERVFTMEYIRTERLSEWAGRDVPLTFDDEDIRALIGTMARFPRFFETGVRLLEGARRIR